MQSLIRSNGGLTRKEIAVVETTHNRGTTPSHCTNVETGALNPRKLGVIIGAGSIGARARLQLEKTLGR